MSGCLFCLLAAKRSVSVNATLTVQLFSAQDGEPGVRILAERCPNHAEMEMVLSVTVVEEKKPELYGEGSPSLFPSRQRFELEPCERCISCGGDGLSRSTPHACRYCEGTGRRG